MRKLILIDGNYTIMSAWHALPDLTTADGRHTNALYGFIMHMNRIFETFNPEFICVAFDKGRPERKDMYAAYKDGRSEKPEEIREQFPYVAEYLSVAKIPYVSVDKMEADDIIASLTDKFCGIEDLEIIIDTHDKDMLQLCTVPNVFVYKYGKDPDTGLSGEMVLNTEDVTRFMGVAPSKIPDFRGIVGDSSDNIKGVLGVGPAGALSVLSKYASVDAGYEDEFKLCAKGVQTKMLAHKEDFLLSRKLIQPIIRETKITLDALQPKPLNIEEINAFYKKYELNSLIV